MPRGPSVKSEKTRRRIYDAALKLFEEQGFSKTTMRDIAQAAGTSPGLAYRYFARKQDLVFDLYASLAVQLERRMLDVPDVDVAARFAFLMQQKLELLRPHRRALSGLVAAALDPEDALGVLSPQSSAVRQHVLQVVRDDVIEFVDVNEETRASLAATFYMLHLLVILFWVHDKSEGQSRTDDVVDLLTRGIRWALPFVHTTAVQKGMRAVLGMLDVGAPVDASDDDNDAPQP